MIAILFTLWRFRSLILIGAFALTLVVGWLWIKALRSDLAAEKIRASAIEAAHNETLASLDRLQAAYKRDSELLADIGRKERVRSEKVKAVTKTIIDSDPAKECPVAESIDAAIDGVLE